jgi:glycosyltransferase involved in cell wall biosynthesis
MTAGRATVSTDVGGVTEAVGDTGLVVPPRDPAAMAEACLQLLRDPQLRQRLGAGARTRALEFFTVEQAVDTFRSIYAELAGGPASRRAPR